MYCTILFSITLVAVSLTEQIITRDWGETMSCIDLKKQCNVCLLITGFINQHHNTTTVHCFRMICGFEVII